MIDLAHVLDLAQAGLGDGEDHVVLRRYALPREEANGTARTIFTRLLAFPAPDL